MSDSEDECSRDSGSSGMQTPVPRSRSPSQESVRSAASCRSRTRYETERSPTRSRSPRREDPEKMALLAENRALKQRLEEMARTIEAQRTEIASLKAQQQAQHCETTSRLSDIARMLESQGASGKNNKIAPSVSGMEMETDQDQPRTTKGPTSKAHGPQAQEGKSSESQTGDKKTTTPTEKEKEKEPKIPPVILRNKDNWNEISKLLKNAGINYTKARLIGEGIQVFPARKEDYRALTRLLNEGNREYHTYSLPENKLKRVVIRGLPDGLPLDEIKEDLEEQGFSPRSVQRMKSRRTKQNMPLVLVQVPEKDEGILAVTRCCGLVVRTEAQKQSKEISQCHRCQRFGHSQSNCSAKPRCVKCAGAHHSGDCKKAPTDPAKCANCEGPHPASYKGCAKYPSKKTGKQKRTQETTKKEAPRQGPPPKPVQQPAAGPRPRSFAEAAKKGAAGAAPQNRAPAAAPAAAASTQDLTAVLAQMQQMCAAMSAFFAKMPALGKI